MFVGTILFGAGSGLAGPEPADPSEFVGKWQVGFQTSDGDIVNNPEIDCTHPAVITQIGDHMINVKTPNGAEANWAVKLFGDAYPWWMDDDVQVTMVAKWVEWEAFLLAGKDQSGVKTDWDNARQWTRCPD